MPIRLITGYSHLKELIDIVIPDKRSAADCRSGIQRKGEAKPHKILDPVCVKLALQVTNGMTVLYSNNYRMRG